MSDPWTCSSEFLYIVSYETLIRICQGKVSQTRQRNLLESLLPGEMSAMELESDKRVRIHSEIVLDVRV